MMGFHNRYTGRNTVFHLLPNAQWQMTAKKFPHSAKEIVVLEAGFCSVGLRLSVAAGETVRLPELIFFGAQSKTDLDAYKLHEWYNRKYPRKSLPIVYNSWLYCYDNIDVDDILRQVDCAAEMGFEAFLGVNPWTALFTLANTVTLFIVLKKNLFKPVMKMIEDRQNEIDDMYRKADDSKQQAEALQAQYEEKFAAATQEAERIVKEAVHRGHDREAEIIRAANEEASAIREKASADIAQEKKKAVAEAKGEISDLSLEIAEKIIEKSLDSGDQKRLVDGFISRLGETL
jgi:F-type H+-transporting ATPase subunit b